MTDDLIEQAAQAIAYEMLDTMGDSKGVFWSSVNGPSKESARNAARAALSLVKPAIAQEGNVEVVREKFQRVARDGIGSLRRHMNDEEIKLVASTLPRSSPLDAWREMSAAPKDGTRILVDFQGAGPIVAFTTDHYPDGWVRYLGFGKSTLWPTVHADRALGWQPLPPPSTKGGQE